MLGGESRRVTLECHNRMAGIIIDRFGQNTVMLRKDEDHFIAHVEVIPSHQFLGWIIGLGTDVKIIAPADVMKNMNETLSKQMQMYQ